MAYADVNGLKLYYESHGAGRPVVALHGGLQSIDLSFAAVLPTLAEGRRVIGVDLQGHGRTTDSDRDMALPNLAGDVVELLDQLGVEQADFFGFSVGGLTALTVATLHPERVGRLVLTSTHFRQDGFHSEIRAADQTAARMPTQEEFRSWQESYQRIAPNPDHFGAVAEKLSAVVNSFTDWTPDQLRAITAPTLIVLGDHDFVRLEHAVELHELLPDARLAVLPGTRHTEVMRRPELRSMVAEFLPVQ
jgi:pimeloyl-ACP methyl ester carboxylesterase